MAFPAAVFVSEYDMLIVNEVFGQFNDDEFHIGALGGHHDLKAREVFTSIIRTIR
ncbi:hypothetical protein A2U01_0092062, partial [Trifolium medium]|nr:hypothetical protein [Trifolium medium]